MSKFIISSCILRLGKLFDKKIVQINLTFVLVFGIGQPICFTFETNTFFKLKSNNVEYC